MPVIPSLTNNVVEFATIEPVNEDDKVPVIVRGIIPADGTWDTIYVWFKITVFANIVPPVRIIPTNIFPVIPSLTVNVLVDIEPVNEDVKVPLTVVLTANVGACDTLYDWAVIVVPPTILGPDIVIPTIIIPVTEGSITVNVVENAGIEPVNDADKVPVIVTVPVSIVGACDTV